MGEKRDGGTESKRLAFLAMFFARSHRMLYRAQYVDELGEEMGFSSAEVRAYALALQSRGLLRELSTLSPRGPLMEITPAGIRVVQRSIAADARAEQRAE